MHATTTVPQDNPIKLPRKIHSPEKSGNLQPMTTKCIRNDQPRSKGPFRQSPPFALSTLFFVIFLLLFASTVPAWAAQVTLAWDANTPAPDGYMVFQRIEGDSYNYNQPVWTGNATSCTLDTVYSDIQYYFVVRAYAGTDESGDSNEVGFYLASDNTGGTTGSGTGSSGTISSQPPDQPAITSPVDGETSVSPRVKMIASDFADPDANDTHTRSEWQIVSVDDQQIALQVERTHQLTNLRVPRFVLRGNTTYSARVRYFDGSGNGSDWSAPVTFTTSASSSARADANAAGTTLDATTDINANGVADLNETGVIQRFSTSNGVYAVSVAVEEDGSGAVLEEAGSVASEDEASTPPNVGDLHEVGLIGYRISVPQPGDEAAVQFYFDTIVDPESRWIMFGADGEWSDDTAMVFAQPLDNMFVRLLTDGGPGDADGVANGTIVELVAPLSADASGTYLDSNGTDTNAAASGGGGGCFMNTLLK